MRQRKLPKKGKQKKGGKEFHIFIKTEFILEKYHKQEPEQFQELFHVFQKALEMLSEFNG